VGWIANSLHTPRRGNEELNANELKSARGAIQTSSPSPSSTPTSLKYINININMNKYINAWLENNIKRKRKERK